MLRTAGMNADIVGDLIDDPVLFGFDAAPTRLAACEQTSEPRSSAGRNGSPFAHAVLDLAALSLSARAVLALRN